MNRLQQKVKSKLFPSRLSLEILLYFLIAGGAAVGLYFGLNYFSDNMIIKRISNSAVIQEQTERELESFREYVAVNELSTADTDAISSWIYEEKYVLMSVYKDEYLIYSNYPGTEKNTYGHVSVKKSTSALPLYDRLYEVTFSDGVAQVGIYILAASKVYNAVQVIQITLAFVCFILIFFFVVSSKFKYISRLQSEMEIIGSGDLRFPVTIKGRDEISFLARGIDEMRKSFIDRAKNEDEARRANSELITSISHDLRTPLTILIGNLDVVADKKYKNEEQYERYIDTCRNKAYQIKDLSDKLFEYFLVSGGEFEEPELLGVDGSKLLNQLIGEYALSLDDQGFSVDILSDETACFIEADATAVRRIFDNLFGNIQKYAVPKSKVTVTLASSGSILSVSLRNQIGEASRKLKSTNIGLATCEKIMAQHGGLLSVVKTEGVFCVTIGFPIKKNCN